jgi:copper chaperone CopZ
MSIKDYIIKQMLKTDIVSDLPGRLRLKLSHHKNIPGEAFDYVQHVIEAISMLDGVQSVKFNTAIGTALITYESEQLSSQKILGWIEDVTKTGLENTELIKKLGQTDPDYLKAHIEKLLREKLKEKR